MRAFAGSMRELIEQDFLLEDQMALLATRNRLDDLYHGRGEEPDDPDTVPILVGMVISLALEAERAAKEAARVAYRASQSIVDLMMMHWFKVAPPKAGCEPPLKKTGSLQDFIDRAAEDERRARELRDLRRARDRDGWKWQKSETAPAPERLPRPRPTAPRPRAARPLRRTSATSPLARRRSRSPGRRPWTPARRSGVSTGARR